MSAEVGASLKTKKKYNKGFSLFRIFLYSFFPIIIRDFLTEIKAIELFLPLASLLSQNVTGCCLLRFRGQGALAFGQFQSSLLALLLLLLLLRPSSSEFGVVRGSVIGPGCQ
jgi:hypothetical protein